MDHARVTSKIEQRYPNYSSRLDGHFESDGRTINEVNKPKKIRRKPRQKWLSACPLGELGRTRQRRLSPFGRLKPDHRKSTSPELKSAAGPKVRRRSPS